MEIVLSLVGHGTTAEYYITEVAEKCYFEEIKDLGYTEAEAKRIVWSNMRASQIYAFSCKGISLGFVVYRATETTLELGFLYIHPLQRGRGIATKVLTEIFTKNQGKKVTSTVFTKNTASIKLHEKLGFKPMCTTYLMINS